MEEQSPCTGADMTLRVPSWFTRCNQGCPHHLFERFTSTMGQRPRAIDTLQLDNYAKEVPVAEKAGRGAIPKHSPV